MKLYAITYDWTAWAPEERECCDICGCIFETYAHNEREALRIFREEKHAFFQSIVNKLKPYYNTERYWPCKITRCEIIH